MKLLKWLTIILISLTITFYLFKYVFNHYLYDLILFDSREYHSLNIKESKLANIFKFSFTLSNKKFVHNNDTIIFNECWVENVAESGNFRTKPKNIKYNEYLLIITYDNNCHSKYNQIFANIGGDRIGELSRSNAILVNYSLLIEQQSKKDTIQIDLIANEDTANSQKLILIKNKN